MKLILRPTWVFSIWEGEIMEQEENIINQIIDILFKNKLSFKEMENVLKQCRLSLRNFYLNR